MRPVLEALFDADGPWMRGLDRQFATRRVRTGPVLPRPVSFPKGTDLSIHNAADLREVAQELNARPRRVLGWRTPDEVLTTRVAMTA
jgi:IS30 family transposase